MHGKSLEENAMTISTARDVVDRYFSALRSKDFTTMRTLLDDNVSFIGPLGTTDGADEYIEAMKKVTANMTDVERHALFAEGEDVCQVYDLVTSTPSVSVPVVQWLKVREERIAMVRLFFDPRPYLDPASS